MTFLITYSCKLIPFIYPHFMQLVKGKSYKQSLSWKYSPFFIVQLSIMCSGHVTWCSHKSPKAQALLIYQNQCYLLTVFLLFFFSFSCTGSNWPFLISERTTGCLFTIVFALRLYFSLFRSSESLELWKSSKPKEKRETFMLGIHDCSGAHPSTLPTHHNLCTHKVFSLLLYHLREGVEV